MLIKFFCDNHCFDFTKDELELNQERAITHCPFCGQKLHIVNLDEIVYQDIEERVKNNIDKWVKEIGWDNVIDLIKRNREQSCVRLYIKELQERGFKIKEEK